MGLVERGLGRWPTKTEREDELELYLCCKMVPIRSVEIATRDMCVYRGEHERGGGV